MKTSLNILTLSVILFILSACSSNKIFNPKFSDVYSPIVELETKFGNMEIQLFANTPKHRDNFIKLTKEGFYDSLLFHRVIKDFMIQGGDPDSKGAAAGSMLGMGGPGYTVDAEFQDEYVHLKGYLSAARQGDQVNPEKKSSGSQFYIVQGTEVAESMLDLIEKRKGFKYTEEQRKQYQEIGGTPHLDRDYTVFGKVIKGLDVLDKIANEAVDRMNRPNEDILMSVKLKKG
ncbi:MAG: peptidylprolyl isomerase [Aureispira sp.]|nr:peptidylprolyl isomerase [Aureispira sp.]